MAAQTRDLKIVRYGTPGSGRQDLTLPLAANVTLYAGGVAVFRPAASGLIDPSGGSSGQTGGAGVASTDIVFGVVSGQVGSNPPINTPIGPFSTAGAVQIEVQTGTFFLQNSTTTDLLSVANSGATVYLVDHQTVAKTNGGGTRPAAGVLQAFDPTQPGPCGVTLGNNQTTGAP